MAAAAAGCADDMVALQLRSRPIPIRIVGGLQVDQIDLPTVEINAEQPLPVSGDVAVKNGVTINSNKALPILGQVLVEEIKGSVSVDEIRVPVDVVNSSPLKVQGRVEIDGKVNVEGSVGASVKPNSSELSHGSKEDDWSKASLLTRSY